MSLGKINFNSVFAKMQYLSRIIEDKISNIAFLKKKELEEKNEASKGILESMKNALNGKVVDSEDVVRATEVPIGGYGIFPKADLSEIYVKSWNNNGTTSVFTFKPSIPPEPVEETSNKDIQSLIEKISNLETKIDSLCGSQVKEEKPAAKKESVNF